MDRYVVIDLETTGHASSKDDRIIEVGIVVIENEEITEKFSTFVNPLRPIPNFIQVLTNISDQDVVDAPLFEEVANEINDFFKNSYLIAHNVPFDLGFLNDELKFAGYEPLCCPVIDTVELSRILLPQAPSYKLSEVSSYLDIHHDQPHRALSDAYVTAQLLLKLLKKLKQLPLETLQELTSLERYLQSDLSGILEKELLISNVRKNDSLEYEVYDGIAFLELETLSAAQPVITDTYEEFITKLYKPNGLLSKIYPNYEERAGQMELSNKIYEVFTRPDHALIEAGTGTGKTLGYLLPLIYKACIENERIIVSTYTTQLQSQLYNYEIPLLKKVLGFSFDAVVLKGKRHYLSLEKFVFELRKTTNINYDIVLAKAIILVWITESNTGDFDEIQLPTGAGHFQLRISAEAEGNDYMKSPWLEFSYHERTKKLAEQAHLIITNHALFCLDLISEEKILPKTMYALIDEAHQLEKVAAKQFGDQLGFNQIQVVLNRLGSTQENSNIQLLEKTLKEINESKLLRNWETNYQSLKYELDELFRQLHHYTRTVTKKQRLYGDTGRTIHHLTDLDYKSSAWIIIKDMCQRIALFLNELLKMLRPSIKELQDHAFDNEADRTNIFIEQLEKIQTTIHAVLMPPDKCKSVKWLEIDALGAKNAVFLYREPLVLAQDFNQYLFSRKKSVILTSATLTVKDSFTYLQERLGLDFEPVETLQIPSPFEYEKLVQLIVPSDFPSVQEDPENYVFALAEAVYSLAQITNGRMLVLFTSYEMLRDTYYLLRELMEEERYMIIAQGISSGSRERLKKNFQSFEHSILLGTNSFWEGIDIPGDDLSAVVIARLPFERPNEPLFKAQSERLLSTGDNPFRQLSLPRAVIRFKQGFGRLVRAKSDRGIVFVCDQRIITKDYGKYFIDSIPKVQLTYDSTKVIIEKAKNWF